jgi:uncharacterized phage protein (TIGR01671 family)
MSREIKFRAWLLERKMWLNWGFSVDETQGTVYDSDLAEYSNGKDVVLIQYTGLKDKNGKEIYEGDIVKAQDGVWNVEIRDLEEGVFLTNDVQKRASIEHADGDYCLRETEVIGNIYENPELLK